MSESVDALELIALAQTSLRDTVLPETSGEQRYAVLMIANALAIALRQLRAGEEQSRHQPHALYTLLSVSAEDSGELEHALCVAIRQGDADPGEPLHSEVRKFLEVTTEQRLRRSNPRYLTPQQ